MKPVQLAHLQNIAYGGLMRTKTPEDVAEQLIRGGYATKAVGGLVATDMAHRLLVANGMKPKAWQ